MPEMPGCEKYAGQCDATCTAAHAVRSYAASDGKRLADLYGHLPGYWLHPALVVATFEKNVTKWSGAPSCRAAGARCGSDAPSAGQPTDQLVEVRGIKTTKKLKAGAESFAT